MSWLGTFSAVTMGLAVLLTMIFSGIQSHPAGYIAGEEPLVTAIPVAGTTFISGKAHPVVFCSEFVFTLCYL